MCSDVFFLHRLPRREKVSHFSQPDENLTAEAGLSLLGKRRQQQM